MKAKIFDQNFEKDANIVESLDLSKAKRVLRDQKRKGVYSPQ